MSGFVFGNVTEGTMLLHFTVFEVAKLRLVSCSLIEGDMISLHFVALSDFLKFSSVTLTYLTSCQLCFSLKVRQDGGLELSDEADDRCQ